MNAYTGFAGVYETFMDNVPYEEWAEYLIGLLKEYGIKDGLIAELGCGTGMMTRLLAKAGYDMIGIDLSEEMLDIARYEHPEAREDILYLHQDMREFELFGTVAAVVSLCDSMNYITSEEDLLKVFRLVNNYLDPGGVFIFDMNTVYKYENLLGDRVIAENRDDCSLIWENYYDREEQLNQYDITIYSKVEFEEDWETEQEEGYREDGQENREERQESEEEGQENGEEGQENEEEGQENGEERQKNEEEGQEKEEEGQEKEETGQEEGYREEEQKNGQKSAAAEPVLYERFEETHLQRAYSVEKVISLLKKAGLEFVAVYGVGTREAPKENTERVYFIAREKFQEKKSYEYNQKN